MVSLIGMSGLNSSWEKALGDDPTKLTNEINLSSTFSFNAGSVNNNFAEAGIMLGGMAP